MYSSPKAPRFLAAGASRLTLASRKLTESLPKVGSGSAPSFVRSTRAILDRKVNNLVFQTATHSNPSQRKEQTARGNSIDSLETQGKNQVPAGTNPIDPLLQDAIGSPADTHSILPEGSIQSIHRGTSVSTVHSNTRT